ncbi:UDP-N-acetylmuramoyl-L-alanine--D-glutamate ligase [Aneurinibacillus sp. Ricciae_BoGa-3]|uniref:UDP-N-acetylmuramoyl-L-alanine--D-glutamate ligase n=1 Tax=Aneurinibacillus sp. Ricciae_BoGa-3 TaxID=3022697 RepID=UPI00233FB860|nr:UDP-N-acetylmuramoyl-L-alanine--D-glutamate ligase [Aneurinibacillus sp. Ricciae_BoGa-3]WCK53086.1 UDP-N-acetylmuramoyl-L-alanine--D-glutamate ligase [Aneurinibacillus sp. Ricciae_BoGa-3]
MSKEKGKQFAGKKIVVLGLAKSGVAVAKLMKQFGATVTVNDKKPREEAAGVEELERLGIPVICGYHPDDLLDESVDLVIKNPGIPYTVAPVRAALALKIPVITEVEIAYLLSDAPIIGITGSNGKTTTTTLVGEILREATLSPVVAGNIGTVLSEQAVTVTSDQILVAELSSFQLKGTRDFRPQIACILNVYDAHLDYHKTKEDYIHSKFNLLVNQREEDIAVLNYDNEGTCSAAAYTKAAILWFSVKEEIAQGSFVKDGFVVFKKPAAGPLQDKLADSPEVERIIRVEEIALPGGHNLENVLAAVSIARAAGASAQAIAHVLRSFAGVEHRIEFVAEINGVKYYNDSKATNPAAAIPALRAFKEPIVLIAGGLDRGIDFKELVPLLKEHASGLVVYGQTAEILAKRGTEAGIKIIKRVDNVRDAVASAHLIAHPGDVVLLSPACASWDMYKSFEERGSIFKESVHKLKTSR